MKQTILVTGGSTGIGAETARTLAGGNLLIVHYYSSKDAAEDVAKAVQAAGGEAVTVQADLRTEAGCEEVAACVRSHAEALDVLVNNAGGLIKRQAVDELSWELMSEIFSLNVFSLMKMTSLCVPLLHEAEAPCIVNISSVAARSGAPSATIYGAAKGAVDSFTRGCAKELAPKIRVNAVAPGVIETPFHEKVSTPERMAQFREAAALKRNGVAADIAQAVAFLIENDFATGETIDINGGMYMR